MNSRVFIFSMGLAVVLGAGFFLLRPGSVKPGTARQDRLESGGKDGIGSGNTESGRAVLPAREEISTALKPTHSALFERAMQGVAQSLERGIMPRPPVSWKNWRPVRSAIN